MNYQKIAQEQEEYTIKMRNEFHSNPELSGKEYKTVRRICEELDSFDIPYEIVNDVNVVGVIDTKKEGKTLAIRADIDALPMQEERECEYKSKVDGVMHSCGHDVHAAILLGTSKALSKLQDELSGKIYLCFQSGEELRLGADEIVDYLEKEGGVDNAIGLHIAASYDTNTVLLPDGSLAAGSSYWKLTIKGKGGHASMPHLSIDPVRPLCESVLRFGAIPSNNIDATEPLVITTSMINIENQAPNIISDEVTAIGTIRFYSLEAEEKAREIMKNISENVAESYGATAIFELAKEPSIPVVNDRIAAGIGREALRECGLDVMDQGKIMGTDNFGVFLKQYPGFYAMFGAGNDENGRYPNHHPKFDVDEDAFTKGIEFFLRSADKFLNMRRT